MHSFGYVENRVAEKHDPENRLFWRRPLRRLEAEVIRDAMMAASGRIEWSMYGPGGLDEAVSRRSIDRTSLLYPSAAADEAERGDVSGLLVIHIKLPPPF